jgi:LEA14-like dessication related protein
MDLKNLMSHVVRPVNSTTTGELPAMQELAQLSEEEMQQIWGGGESLSAEFLMQIKAGAEQELSIPVSTVTAVTSIAAINAKIDINTR